MATELAGHNFTSDTTIADDHSLLFFKQGDDQRVTWVNFITALVAKFAAGTSVPTMVGDKIQLENMPISAFTYKGIYDATADSPDLTNGTGTAGDFYIVQNPATVDHGGGNVAYVAGDGTAYNGSVWGRIPGLANVLNGISTAADARTTLEVWSKGETSGITKPRGGVRLVRSGTSNVTIPNGPFQTPTTGDCTFVWSLSDIVKASDNDYLIETHDSGSQGCEIRLDATGDLELIMYGGSTYTVASAMLAPGSYASAVIALTLDRDGLATAYLNGVSKGTVDISADAAIDWSANSDSARLGLSSSGVTLNATYHAFGFATRAMSAAEIAELSRSLRILDRDAGASTTASSTSDWSVNVNGWVADSATLTAVQTATYNAVEKTNCLRIAAAAVSGTHGAYKTGLYTVGKSALTVIEAGIASTLTNVGRLRLKQTTSLTTIGTITTQDVWVKKAFYHLPATNGLFLQLQTDAGAESFTGAGGADDYVDIASITIYQAGWTLWLDGRSILGTTWIGHNGVDHKSVCTIAGGTSVAEHGPVRITTKSGTASTPVLEVYDSTGLRAKIQENGVIIENVVEAASAAAVAVGQKWWKTGTGTTGERPVLVKDA